ncbi:MerR family transcriptional regulator [Rugosimonospora africana]|uniref:MerR HTH family regulatory protein n=1 Tax=Rugosimonospora africana TaxID=556532 RepID=A0A8J3QVS0_9ACTN|nr:MerR family transcriptional regulator [Rugosimonospora africana]GIH17386.1 hypothetical protein Raf01_55580 [Rugosimonospora africana]
MTDGWTLDELVRRVADALAADDIRAPNGRVRDVPDGRAIRWYTTIGLMDRPVGFRGRTALYGPRHLLQAVAVKRRQADGLALAQIQAELAGATDATLRRVARIPEAPHAPRLPEVAAPPTPSGVTPPPAPEPAAPSAPVGAAPVGAAPVAPGSAPARRWDRFWVEPPAPVAELRYRVVLAGGVALELPAAPSPRDLADLNSASAPLIRFLAERGLLTPEESSE